MTLVLSVHSRDSLWLVVDRRLSYGPHRRPTDTAVKVMCLETTDGVGLLGYAGLGATPRGTQPSEWMGAVLRGRGVLTFEQALGVLADASTKELPRHLARTPAGAHFILIPGFVTGVGPRLYSIDNVVDQKSKKHFYRYTRHERTALPGSPSPRLAVAGTGGIYLHSRGRRWSRALLSLVNAHDQASDHVIADHLARLNYEAHQNVRDGSVGPHCIVVWRRRPDAAPGAGGGHQFYTGTDRDKDSASIPIIARGIDVTAFAGLLMTALQERGFPPGVGVDVDKDEMNRRLAELPSEPDETLR